MSKIKIGTNVLLRTRQSGEVKIDMGDGVFYLKDGTAFLKDDVLTICPKVEPRDTVIFKDFDEMKGFYPGDGPKDVFGIIENNFPETGVVSSISSLCDDYDYTFEIEGSDLFFKTSMVKEVIPAEVFTVYVYNTGFISNKFNIDRRERRARKFPSREAAVKFMDLFYKNTRYKIIGG